MEILLGFEMEKTGENLEYWPKNFTEILGHILIRDTENEIYWAIYFLKGKIAFALFARRPVLNWWLVQALMPIQGEFLLFKSNGFLDSGLDGDARTTTLAKPSGPFPLSSTRKRVLLLEIFLPLQRDKWRVEWVRHSVLQKSVEWETGVEAKKYYFWRFLTIKKLGKLFQSFQGMLKVLLTIHFLSTSKKGCRVRQLMWLIKFYKAFWLKSY